MTTAKQKPIPIAFQLLAVLAALARSTHIVCLLCSWGLTRLLSTQKSKSKGYRPGITMTTQPPPSLVVWCWLTIMVVFSGASRAEISASISKHSFTFEEAIEFTVFATTSLVPTLSTESLENDFIVAHVERKTRLRSDITPIHYEGNWVVMLYPKFPGNLRIPPVNVNGQQTRAIPIQVLPVDDPLHQPLHKVELSVDTAQALVGQPYLMTVKWLTRHPNAEVSLRWAQKPTLTPILVGNPVTFPTQINNTAYTQTTQRLAWILTDVENTSDGLNHLILETTLILPGERKLPIEAKSNTFLLEIKPDPTASAGTVKPIMAHSVIIRSNLKSADHLTTGSPIKHAVTITAVNGDPERLPKYKFLTQPPLVYTEHDETTTLANVNGQLHASRIASALLTVQEGEEVTIPGWRVRWWNTQNNTWQTSVLTEQTLPLIQPLQSADDPDKDEKKRPWGLIFSAIMGMLYTGYYVYDRRR